MSASGTNRRDGGKKNQKRNLPSWMSSRDPGRESTSHGKKPKEEQKDREDKQTDLSKEHGKASAGPSSSTMEFCKLMEGVVFVLSGFVNPERSILRSQALAMGAVYQPDWNSDSTLLICAFPSTPKFRQVETDSGTIVSKEWIFECFTQRKLVDIDQYLMHAGKPWRKSSSSQQANQEKKESSPAQKSVSKGNTSASSKNGSSRIPAKKQFSPAEVRKWAVDDLSKTISWLEGQEEKPEPSDIRPIAIEGILTCLQDAIDSLEQKQDVGSVMEQWSFVPQAVKELTKIGAAKEELYRQAMVWKKIYEGELRKPNDNDKSSPRNKKHTTDEKGKTGRKGATSRYNSSGYDSDETIEMTEEEIEIAYRTLL